jgi:hypothetical protein
MKTLLQLLLATSEIPAYTVASTLSVTPSCLSRTAASVLHKRSVLRKCAEYFSGKLQGDAIVDSDLLLQTITQESLVMLARKLRIDGLKGGNR